MFDFYTAGRIHYGWGVGAELPDLMADFAERFLVVIDGRVPEHVAFVDDLAARSKGRLRLECFADVDQEPTPEMIDDAVQRGREALCGAVVAIGGGSAIDVGKAAAGLIRGGGHVEEYLEGVGTGRKVDATIPFIAVPTTSGTGAEVTKNAVVTSPQKGYKKSFRSERLLAKLVLVDPSLTVSLPPRQTAASGMDALTQCVEAYISNKRNPLCDALALHGMRLAAGALETAVGDPMNRAAREDMSMAALLSGMALANAGLGAVHGIAASLGAHAGIGHGLACAILLPHVLQVNREAAGERYAVMCGIFGADAVDFVRGLNARIGIPSDLKEFGIPMERLPDIARDSMGSSMSGNPVTWEIERWADFLADLI